MHGLPGKGSRCGAGRKYDGGLSDKAETLTVDLAEAEWAWADGRMPKGRREVWTEFLVCPVAYHCCRRTNKPNTKQRIK
jgi:hypothetical protein